MFIAGHSTADVARELGVRQDTISVWRSETEFKEKLEAATKEIASRATKSVSDEIAEGAAMAPQVLIKIMCDETQPAASRIQAARDLLDRGGYKPADKLEIRKQLDGMSTEEIRVTLIEQLRKEGAIEK